jgi:hypothetical protein
VSTKGGALLELEPLKPEIDSTEGVLEVGIGKILQDEHFRNAMILKITSNPMIMAPPTPASFRSTLTIGVSF